MNNPNLRILTNVNSRMLSGAAYDNRLRCDYCRSLMNEHNEDEKHKLGDWTVCIDCFKDLSKRPEPKK